jgi:uncharacterized membrane protein YgaE (UPF0421/DUF939 family)
MEKFKIFLKKNSLKLILFGIGFVLFLIIIFRAFFDSNKKIKEVEKKVSATIEKVQEKVMNLDIKKQTLDIQNKIDLEKVDNKKNNLEKNLDVIVAIPDRKKRMQKLIEFNKSIKVLK